MLVWRPIQSDYRAKLEITSAPIHVYNSAKVTYGKQKVAFNLHDFPEDTEILENICVLMWQLFLGYY